MSDAADAIEQAQDIVNRAAAFQREADAGGYGRPQPEPPLALKVPIEWMRTGMRLSMAIDVAVVRGAKPARCQQCRHRRVVFSLTLTAVAVGNPEAPWRCANCWGLR